MPSAPPAPTLAPAGPSTAATAPSAAPPVRESHSGPTLAPATGPGSVITIQGGPNATANIVGPHSDASDFFGGLLVVVAILASIGLTRLLFRRRGAAGPPAEGPR